MYGVVVSKVVQCPLSPGGTTRINIMCAGRVEDPEDGLQSPNVCAKPTVRAVLFYADMHSITGMLVFAARYNEVLVSSQWLIDRGHTNPELFELMNLVRAQSEAVLEWEQWFTDGDPKATMTRFSERCWANKTDPTAFNWQRYELHLCCAVRSPQLALFDPPQTHGCMVMCVAVWKWVWVWVLVWVCVRVWVCACVRTV